MILLITGPAGAGKSMTSEEFLQSVTDTWAYINQYEIRQLIKSGYASADDYEHTWSDAVKLQWKVSIELCCDMARRYDSNGISCLIDLNASPEEFSEWRLCLEGLDHKLVILLPDIDTVLDRNSNRDSRSKLKDKKIVQNYDKLDKWSGHGANIIDNSEGTVGKTVDRIKELLK